MLPILFACAAAALLLPPVPDVVPDGHRGVPVERQADISALRESCCVQYVVQKGDTLGKIAVALLGAASRHREIAALNPDVEPDRLSVGQRLWLPRRQADLEEPVRFVYWSDFSGLAHARPLAMGEPLRGRYGSYSLALVPASLHEAFVAKREEGREAMDAFVEQHRIEVVQGTSCGRYVKDGSKVASKSETVRVVRGDDGRFSIESEVVNYDKDGKPLGADAAKKGDSEAAWLLLLAAAAGAGLVYWRVRAANAAKPQPVVA